LAYFASLGASDWCFYGLKLKTLTRDGKTYMTTFGATILEVSQTYSSYSSVGRLLT
jgi:hypothetical protein